ncbi:MAG TPA: FixH family protein [Ktedonobacterales bacterium]
MSAIDEDVHLPVVRRPPFRRLAAVAVACVVLATLGIGWLADSAASYVPSPTSGVLSRHAGLSSVTLSIAPTPLRASQRERFTVRVVDVTGRPLIGAAVRCALSMPTMDMSLTPSAALPTAVAGDYSCDATLPHAGRWVLSVSTEVAGQSPAQTSFEVDAD